MKTIDNFLEQVESKIDICDCGCMHEMEYFTAKEKRNLIMVCREMKKALENLMKFIEEKDHWETYFSKDTRIINAKSILEGEL